MKEFANTVGKAFLWLFKIIGVIILIRLASQIIDNIIPEKNYSLTREELEDALYEIDDRVTDLESRVQELDGEYIY